MSENGFDTFGKSFEIPVRKIADRALQRPHRAPGGRLQ